MSCSSINLGYHLPSCPLDNAGGITTIYIAPFSSSTVFTTNVDNLITNISGITFYTFDLVLETCGWKCEPKTNIQNGSLYWEQTGNIVFNKPNYTLRNQVKALTSSATLWITLDTNGDYKLYGKTKGVWSNGGSSGSGTKLEDANQYNLNFIAKEKEDAFFLSASTSFTSSY
jgi:hypothetical protein